MYQEEAVLGLVALEQLQERVVMMVQDVKEIYHIHIMQQIIQTGYYRMQEQPEQEMVDMYMITLEIKQHVLPIKQ